MSISPNTAQPKRAKLTKRIVDTALAHPEKDIFIWDGEIPGFGLRVTPNGAKSYVFKYREGKGRKALTRRMKIGEPPMTPDQARDIVREKHYLVSKGESPAEQEKKKRDDLFFHEVKELYMKRHAIPFKKPSSVAGDEAHWKVIIEKFGNRRLNSFTRDDMQQYHLALVETPYDANRKLALLSKTFNLCEEWGLRDQHTNPCRGVRKFKEKSRNRPLTLEELTRLSEVLATVEHEKSESFHVVALIRLLVFTGCRLGEIRELKWEHVHFNRRAIELVDSKTGGRTVYMNEPVFQILSRLQRIRAQLGLADNPFVIASHRRHGVCLNNPQDCWQRIRVKAGIPDVRIHDLRHTHATIGATIGLSLPIIGGLLGHTRPETTQRYAHLMNDPLMNATNRIGSAINEVFTPQGNDDDLEAYKIGWRPKEAREQERKLALVKSA